MPPPPFEARFTPRSLAWRLVAWSSLAAVSVVFAHPSGPLADLHVVARVAAWAFAALFLAAHAPPALTGTCVDMFG